jgi:hypothetical protein
MKKKSKKITWLDYEAFRRMLVEKPRIQIAHELCCHPKTLQKILSFGLQSPTGVLQANSSGKPKRRRTR